MEHPNAFHNPGRNAIRGASEPGAPYPTPQRLLGAMLLVAAAMACTSSAHALDGCRVMLCLAAPSWREVPLCVPTINELMKYLAKGRPFPICAGGGPNNGADNAWASAPGNCPVQYVEEMPGPNGPSLRCKYNGAVVVKVNQAVWSRTWWTFAGESVTEFTPAAKAQLGRWDTQFDDDYDKWLASVPPPPPPVSSALTRCADC